MPLIPNGQCPEHNWDNDYHLSLGKKMDFVFQMEFYHIQNFESCICLSSYERKFIQALDMLQPGRKLPVLYSSLSPSHSPPPWKNGYIVVFPPGKFGYIAIFPPFYSHFSPGENLLYSLPPHFQIPDFSNSLVWFNHTKVGTCNINFDTFYSVLFL